MKYRLWLAAILLPAAFMIAASDRNSHREDFPEVQKESFQKIITFSNPAAPKALNVDNVFGSITVTGYDGDAIDLEIARTYRGRTKEDIELAKKEVELRISEKSNRIDLYVDGPFRCRDGSMNSRRLGYRVDYEFRMRAPRNCDLVLRTVTNGDIRVENASGKYDIDNVNGKIQLTDVAGSGRAHTINGGVKALFTRNPAADCSFGSMNGDIDVAFRPDISADFWFKTFNGGAFSDFDLTPLPQVAAEPERRDGRFVYKSNRFYGARAGKGGPQVKFDTFNGNIHVTSR